MMLKWIHFYHTIKEKKKRFLFFSLPISFQQNVELEKDVYCQMTNFEDDIKFCRVVKTKAISRNCLWLS